MAPAELIRQEWVDAEVRKAVDAAHGDLAPFEQIKYYRLLDRDFTMQDGELTPTLKPKRDVILRKFGPLLEPFYAAR